jgi:hypothetical protein
MLQVQQLITQHLRRLTIVDGLMDQIFRKV